MMRSSSDSSSKAIPKKKLSPQDAVFQTCKEEGDAVDTLRALFKSEEGPKIGIDKQDGDGRTALHWWASHMALDLTVTEYDPPGLTDCTFSIF